MEDKNREMNVEELEQAAGGKNAEKSSPTQRAIEDGMNEFEKKVETGFNVAESQQAPQNNSMPNKGIDW